MFEITSSFNLYLENAAVKDLTSIVQEAGISLNSRSNSSRTEALTFIVRANYEKYGNASRKVVDKLIQDIGRLATQNVGRAACEVSWRLHQEVAGLMEYKVKQLELSQNNEESKLGLRAIYDLYLECKSQHFEKYKRGEVVNFAGVPAHDFIPAWHRNISIS